MRSFISLTLALLLFIGAPSAAPQSAAFTTNTQQLPLTLPNRSDSVKFLAFGDMGTGEPRQYELGKVMLDYRSVFKYDFALTMGDNLYGSEEVNDFRTKFEDVYRPIIDQGVTFYATLGNHDDPKQRFYDLFNMHGQDYYRLTKGNVAIYCLNSNYMEKKQIEWLKEELAKDNSRWKIAFFHHPPYSSGGKHGSSSGLRETLEPIFQQYGVDAVFTGHEHFYERIMPQKGIYYFITGAGGQLRKGDLKKNSPLTAKGYDSDLSFMLVEVTNDVMYFQVISRTGETVDSGGLPHRLGRSQ